MNSTLKNTIIDLIVKKMMKEAILKASYLSWGPLNYIAIKIITNVLTKAIDFGILELSVAMMKNDVNKHVETIRKIVEQYNDEITADEKKELDEKLKKSYNDMFEF